MEREPGEHTRDRKKSLEGKEAGLLPPWNGKEGRRGLEQCPRGPPLRPDRRPAGSPGRVPRGARRWEPRPPSAAAAIDSGAPARGAGCGPSVRALELLPEKAGRCGQWARRGLRSEKNGVGVHSMFNLWSRGS